MSDDKNEPSARQKLPPQLFEEVGDELRDVCHRIGRHCEFANAITGVGAGELDAAFWNRLFACSAKCYELIGELVDCREATGEKLRQISCSWVRSKVKSDDEVAISDE